MKRSSDGHAFGARAVPAVGASRPPVDGGGSSTGRRRRGPVADHFISPLIIFVLLGGVLGIGCNGTEEDPDSTPIEVPKENGPETDHWIRSFGPYMSDEFRAAYLATEEKDRFRLHGERLLDFARREFILEGAKVNLTKSELEHFYRLEDAEASKTYVRELEAQPGRVSEPAPEEAPEPKPPS